MHRRYNFSLSKRVYSWHFLYLKHIKCVFFNVLEFMEIESSFSSRKVVRYAKGTILFINLLQISVF